MKSKLNYLLIFIMIFAILVSKSDVSFAANNSTSTDPKTFYNWVINTYGTDTTGVYITSQDKIRFASRGTSSPTANYRYMTIGAQLRIDIGGGNVIWDVLSETNGILTETSKTESDGYVYNIVQMDFSDLKTYIEGHFSSYKNQIENANIDKYKIDQVFTVLTKNSNGTYTQTGKLNSDGTINSNANRVYFALGDNSYSSAGTANPSVPSANIIRNGFSRYTSYDKQVQYDANNSKYSNGIRGAQQWTSTTYNNYSNYFNIQIKRDVNDTAYPVISATPTSRAWDNTSASTSITISDSRSGDTGLYKIWTAIDSNSTTPSLSDSSWTSEYTFTSSQSSKTFTKTISSEGQYYVHIKALDKASNYATNTYGPFKVDESVGQPTIGFSSPSGYTSGTWAKQNVAFTVTAGTDNYSGVKKSQYSTNNGTTWTDYSSAVTISTEGTTTVLARTTDNAGNTSSNTSATIKVDKTAPTQPTINITSPSGYTTGTWTNQNVAFTVTSGTDSGSGVQKTEYSTDGGTTWSTYSSQVTVSTEGTKIVKARTTDKAGNVSPMDTATLKIDKTAPTTPTISFTSPSGYTSGTWANQNVTFKVTAGTDSGSGVAATEYSYNGTTWAAYSAAQTINTEGTNTVYARTKDNAGNNSTSATVTIKIDKTAPTQPTINITSPSGYVTGTWTNQSVKFTVTAGTDSGSGVQKTEYSADGGSTWSTYISQVTVSSEGTTATKARTTDNAGNVSPMDTATLMVDKTAPTGTVTINSGASTTASLNVTLQILDNGTGATDVMISNYSNYTTDGTKPCTWKPYSKTVWDPWSLTSGLGGTRTVYVKLKDTAGNIGTLSPASINFNIPVTVDSISVVGPRSYGDAAAISVIGTNMDSAAYRIYYVTSDSAPRVNTAADASDPGTGWKDGMAGLSGVSITPTSPSNLSASVPGTSLAKTMQDPVTHKKWTYVVFKIWAQSPSGATTQRFSHAYSINEVLNIDPDNYIGAVDFKQLSGSSWTSNPANVFNDGDTVTYRLEFEAASPDKINGLKIDMKFNTQKQSNIELVVQSASIQKQGTGNTFTNITPTPTVTISKQSKNGYAIELGQDAVNAINTGTVNKKYAVQFTAKITASGTGTVSITNDSRIKIATDAVSYMFTITPDKQSRDFSINTKVMR